MMGQAQVSDSGVVRTVYHSPHYPWSHFTKSTAALTSTLLRKRENVRGANCCGLSGLVILQLLMNPTGLPSMSLPLLYTFRVLSMIPVYSVLAMLLTR
jgi:hypothetical protein